MKSQKTIILEYLKEVDDWVFEYKLRAINTPFGWIGARGDRDTRDLIKKNLVEHSFRGKYRIVRYKRARIELPIARLPKTETAKML